MKPDTEHLRKIQDKQ